MASRTVVLYEDDLDGSEAEGTVTFGLEGIDYEVDLSGKNADKLRKALAPYIEAGRRVGGRRRAGGGSSSGSSVDPKAVRAWAESQGMEISARGRVPADIVQQYKEAGN